MSPIVSPRRPRERSHRPSLTVLGGYEGSPAPGPRTDSSDTAPPRQPALRLVEHEQDRARMPVLLVGADARRRAALRAELSATLPPRTRFSEAEEVSEVLERARTSRLAILAGDVSDADADSLIRLLGQRHPRLPVISVDAAVPAAAGGHG